MTHLPLTGKRILILQQRVWGITIGHPLAKHLAESGADLFALTFKKSTHDFVSSQKDVTYHGIINHDSVMENPRAVPGSQELTLEHICQTLGIDTIWPLVAALRNHVRSYREKFYYSFKQNLSDEEIIAYIKALFKTIETIFKDFKPELIVAPNFVSLPHTMLNLYGKKHGVKMFGITDSKVKGYNIFTYDFYESSGPFYDRVDALNNGAQSQNAQRARDYIAGFRTNFKRPEALERYLADQKSLKQRVRSHLAPWYRIYKWYTDRPTDYLKNIGPTIDYRPPAIILRDYWCRMQYRKAAENFEYYPLEKIEKYVYFPLQYQPEASIDVMAPFFSNQVETARLVAQALPDDYTLVVKEHPAMVGYRTPSTFEKLARTVNVKLVDYRIAGEKVLQRAALVVSPNSTTIAEASFLGKQSIQLGNLGTTLKMPGITKHTDLTTLSPLIKKLLATPVDAAAHDRKLENFVAAVFDEGFAVDYQRLWEGEKRPEDPVWELYRKELSHIFNVTI
jgi:hypothetical protein